MNFKLPALPYEADALSPHLSSETLEFHYGRHHKAYIEKLNSLLIDSPLKERSLEDILLLSHGKDAAIFNNAAQSWNHTFYWYCLSPKGKAISESNLLKQIKQDFGSMDDFKKTFTQAAIGQFGSGWAWLVKTVDEKLEIICTSNAENPICNGKMPVLVCDVWEHAYYIDYRNARANYLEHFFELIDWSAISRHFDSKTTPNMTAIMRG